MAKLRLTKNELKKQKDNLKRFSHYLPTLILKKQQLQAEMLKIQKELSRCAEKTDTLSRETAEWADVFAEDIKIKEFISVKNIETHKGSVAGVDIPVLDKIEFSEKGYDPLKMPLWADYGIEAVKEMLSLRIQYKILERQAEAVREELRITTQRVNLFEKVKIPEARENIRKIRIYLGDMQTASVVIGKIAKNKIERKQEAVPV